MFATANPSVGGFDVFVSAIFIGSRETMTQRIRGVLAPVVTPLKLVRCPLARSYPRHFTFYVADPVSSILFLMLPIS